eukprot:Blabericola_migrator_1__3790@NODE_213_length_11357_cov_483_488574_g178_i1_p3_GENE_NODE_213_length_11357_cov_483_488574_g178_i1NODE_213_length_11357_cov_483_488574_g178_i1_p3_ORF_typecomplete_len400_score26_88Hydrolase_4/PF12146_8/2e23Peptidase_S15/PF02129_18/8_1e17Peptidase_S9/PF00326_21/3_4e13Abhydrolase_1/PF00561_20/9e13DUF1100/PF06500_11/2_6e12DUF818/PF05677_12/1_9e10Abhydrolase_6/PF12697_7/1_1e09Acyl_transf_2/PF02273_15/1_2e06Acyl_transf_2/PF02273_15/0_77DLH/PF01738_18/4_7e08BAAT_C/PF08840_1
MLSQLYGELWKAFIRPPRDEYLDEELGATKFKLVRDGKTFMRTDFEVINGRGERLQCSHYEPIDRCNLPRLPCVIYLHGNCSSRIEAHCALATLLPLNITVVGFDFAGSGRSEGEYVTLGWNEEDDLRSVVDYLRENRRVSHLGLWGRSMGAVAALRYASTDALILGMVCDSPFSNLRQLAEEVASNCVWLPHTRVSKFLMGPALYWVKNKIKEKCGLDIDKLDVVDTVKDSSVPVMLIAGIDDTFVRSHHARILFEHYKHSEKWFVEVEGDHNSQRSPRIMDTIGRFFYDHLFCSLIFPQDEQLWRILPSTIFRGDEREYNERSLLMNYISSGASSPSLSAPDFYLAADTAMIPALQEPTLRVPGQMVAPPMRPPVRTTSQLPGAETAAAQAVEDQPK